MFDRFVFYVLRPRDERPPATESATREEGERRRKARGGTEKERKKEGGKEREKRTPSKPGTQHKPTCDRQTRAVSLGLGKKAGAQRAALRGVAAIPKAAQKYICPMGADVRRALRSQSSPKTTPAVRRNGRL